MTNRQGWATAAGLRPAAQPGRLSNINQPDKEGGVFSVFSQGFKQTIRILDGDWGPANRWDWRLEA